MKLTLIFGLVSGILIFIYYYDKIRAGAIYLYQTITKYHKKS